MGFGDVFKKVTSPLGKGANALAKYTDKFTGRTFDMIYAFTPKGMLEPFTQLLNQNPFLVPLLGFGAVVAIVLVIMVKAK